MQIRILDPVRDQSAWRSLWIRSKGDFRTFRGFLFQAQKIFLGDYLLLRRRFLITRYGLFEGERLVACAIHFRATSQAMGPRSSLGGLLFDPSLSEEGLHHFAANLVQQTGPIDVAPLNGHMNLGLSHPETGTPASAIAFLCAPLSVQTERFLKAPGLFKVQRRLFGMVTPVDECLIKKVSVPPPPEFSVRALSRIHFKHEMQIYNKLVNLAMNGHPHFFPLDPAEEWELMANALLLVKPDWFQFLLHRGREIGFCFALPDYILSSSRSDTINLLSILRQRFRPIPRGRLVYSCIHPEFKGKGLIKFVRGPVIEAMIRSGVEEIESSYIDQDNASSFGNVKSMGGQPTHAFELFTSN